MENYFLCSKAVVDFINPTKVSKPFKSGYSFDKDEDYFVAVFDFNIINERYNNLTEDESVDFWCKEIVPGTMDVSSITLKGIKEWGLLMQIEMKLNLTSIRNIAMVIYNLSEKYNCTPIEFINKYTK